MRLPVVPYELSFSYRAQTTYSNGSESDAANDTVVDTTPVVPRRGEIEISVWQHYLINQWLFQQTRPVSKASHRVIITQFGEVVERFLRRGVVGAETRFIVWVSRLDQTKVYFAIGGDPAGVGWVTTKTLVDACWVGLEEYPVGVDKLQKKIAACPATGWETTLVYLCSLRSWIEGLDSTDVPNKDEILRLLDGKEPALRGHLSPRAGSKASGLRVLRDLVERIGVGYAIIITLGKHRISDLAACLQSR